MREGRLRRPYEPTARLPRLVFVTVVDRAILKGVSAAEARISRGAVESFMSAVDAPTP